jgi:hypothetical protein
VRGVYRVLVERERERERDLREGDNPNDLVEDGRIILRWIFRKWD